MTLNAPACPWCGQLRVRGVPESPDGHQWYRCGACRTAFFVNGPPRSLASFTWLSPPPDRAAPRETRRFWHWIRRPFALKA